VAGERGADRYDHRQGNDDYTQAGDLFRLMTQAQRAVLMDNMVASMSGAPETILRRQIEHLTKADPAYGQGVAARLGVTA
jgi:catalase